jgi:predicted PurR-regulated permease PerM
MTSPFSSFHKSKMSLGFIITTRRALAVLYKFASWLGSTLCSSVVCVCCVAFGWVFRRVTSSPRPFSSLFQFISFCGFLLIVMFVFFTCFADKLGCSYHLAPTTNVDYLQTPSQLQSTIFLSALPLAPCLLLQKPRNDHSHLKMIISKEIIRSEP